MVAAQPSSDGRRQREARTLRLMIALYCHDHHAAAPIVGARGSQVAAPATLCPDCAALAIVCAGALEHCPYGANKPVCATVRCTAISPPGGKKSPRSLRYAGPRMLRRHPLLAVAHLRDSRRRLPDPVSHAAAAKQ
ncbi:MAG: nitrous oxide-stimulated promoter family protein [Thermoleophilia bacterium]